MACLADDEPPSPSEPASAGAPSPAAPPSSCVGGSSAAANENLSSARSRVPSEKARTKHTRRNVFDGLLLGRGVVRSSSGGLRRGLRRFTSDRDESVRRPRTTTSDTCGVADGTLSTPLYSGCSAGGSSSAVVDDNSNTTHENTRKATRQKRGQAMLLQTWRRQQVSHDRTHEWRHEDWRHNHANDHDDDLHQEEEEVTHQRTVKASKKGGWRSFAAPF